MSTRRGFMWSALEEAERGRGRVGVNPLVGALVVKDGVELSRGAHLQLGGAHAEAAALEEVDAAGATLYCTLEPCAHDGRTPACAPLVAKSGIVRAIIGMKDPDPRTNGRGIAALEAAGVEVEVGFMEREVRRQNLHYLVGVEKGRAALTLKVGTSLDGRIAAADGGSEWVTDERCRRDGRGLRNHHEAILVGAGTVLADDPLLARDGQADLPWLKVVVDRQGRIPAESRLFAAGEVLWWGPDGAKAPAGAEGIHPENLEALLVALRERGIGSVLAEGGDLAAALLEERLVDRFVAYVAPRVVGAGGKGFSPASWTSLPEGMELADVRITPLGRGVRIAGEVRPCSPG